MSEDEVRRFWCLLEDEQTVFSVNASLRWDVGQLTDAIKERRPRLQTIDIINLVLWKVDDPIPVNDDDDTLPQLLSKPFADFSVKLKHTQDLSDVFPNLPEDHHLHIIVQLLDQALERPAKRVKLEHESDPSLDRYRHFRDYYWGENRIKPRTEGGQTFSILDLTSANLSVLNHGSIKILFIRDEYKFAYDAIVKRISETPGEKIAFLLTGQPGIGKTLFLLFLLVLILGERQAVALQINVDNFILFDESGVSKYGKYDNFAIPKGAWTLSDSESLEPCKAFQYSKGHVVHTSSAASGHWKEWVKQLGAGRYIMDVWSEEEFRALLTISDLNVPRGVTFFTKYGSNVRRIIDMLKDPQEEATHDLDVKSAAADLARDFSTILLDLQRLDFKSKLSSMIIAVRPNNLELRLPVLTIPTPYLFKTLVATVSQLAVAQQHLIFTMLTAHPSLGTAAGWWFKNYAHVRLSDPTRSPIQTHIHGVSNPPSIPAPKAVLVGANALRNIRPPFDFYWRPRREPNFEGIDGAIRVGNTVRVQQYTTSSSHRSATEGLEKVRKTMGSIRGVHWELDIVGPNLSVAKSVRDSHKLTGPWANTPIYASELQIGILDKEMLQRVLNEATDDTYPEYRMGSTTGFQFSSSSTPVHVLSGSTMGQEMGLTGVPYRRSARISKLRKVSPQKKSNTPSTRHGGATS